MAVLISSSRIKLKGVRISAGGSASATPSQPTPTTTRILLQNGSGYVQPESGTGGSAFTLG